MIFQNPILVRAVRTRFRGMRTFWLMMAYAIAMMILTVVFYGDAQPGADRALQTLDARITDRLGRQLFFSIASYQIFGWLFLGPVLSATGLAGERERGLLESVQLSRLSPWSISGGTLASAFSFVLLLLPISLPMAATCFLLGGVAPMELLAVVALQITTALFGVCLGLFCSARARRAQTALASALLATTALVYFGFIRYWGGGFVGMVNAPFGVLSSDNIVDFVMSLLSLFAAAVTPFRSLNILQLASRFTGAGVPMPTTLTPSLLPAWAWTCLAQLTASGLLVFFATRALRRPMPEPTPSDTDWTRPWRLSLQRSQQNARVQRQLLLERSSRARDEAERREDLRAAQLSENAAKAGAFLLRELPFEKLINFRDAVLRRELKSKFRWRHSSTLMAIGQGLLAILILGFYTLLVFAVFFPAERREILQGTFFLLFIAVLAACAAMSAGTLTRERESGTWESLRLSLLPVSAVLRAKIIAPLIACFYYALPLWILMPFFLQFSDVTQVSGHGLNPLAFSGSTVGNSGASFFNNGIPLSQFLVFFAVLTLLALFCSSFGTLCSALFRQTIGAMSATLIGLVVVFFVMPQFLQRVLSWIPWFTRWFNETYAMYYLGSIRIPENEPTISYPPSVYYPGTITPYWDNVVWFDLLNPLNAVNALLSGAGMRVLSIYIWLIPLLCGAMWWMTARRVARFEDDLR